MGFIDYVAEYFRGPAGVQGDPGPAGPAASIEVVQHEVSLPDDAQGETFQIYYPTPTGKAVIGTALLGDKSAFELLTAQAPNGETGDVQVEYRYDGPTHPAPTATLDLLIFYKTL